MSDPQTTARAVKAVKMIHQLRLDMAALNPDLCDPDASDLAMVLNDLSPKAMVQLAERSGVTPPSNDTCDMVRILSMAMVITEERYSSLDTPQEILGR